MDETDLETEHSGEPLGDCAAVAYPRWCPESPMSISDTLWGILPQFAGRRKAARRFVSGGTVQR
ncbi:MAG: hypothetical protein D6759_04430 [Chloroflexi bacterium]|nr:MAG: hypothetical protein D6759_04430 [Chloroflexota bacterium]